MSLRSPQDQKHPKQNGKWNNNVGESSNHRRSGISFYVKLAPESPLRKNSDIMHDESSYDSFHNYETDICKDSSDDDYSDANSSHTEGFAVMDVIEYELPDDSESDDVSSASSGTDDFTLEAATAACYEFNALMRSHAADLSDGDSDEFILADTGEDSDGPIDMELGQADYWKCIKCNNKQNNPLYRFCERCYQVRKSLFPPRPKRQKSRAEHNRKRKMAHDQEFSSSEVESDSDTQVPMAKKIALSPRREDIIPSINTSVGSKNGNQLNLKDKKLNSESNKHANSAGELSCNNNTSSDDGDDGDAELALSSDADVVRKIKVSPSSSIEISKVHVADCSSYSSTTLVKLAPSHLNDNYLEYKLENKIIQNVYRQEFLLQKRPNSIDWKDSGVSSCQESSQEFSMSPREEGFLVRSSSSGSTRSFDSQNDFPASQASTQIQGDSDDDTDSEGILTRVEEFTQQRQGKMKQELSSSGICCKPAPYSETLSQAEDTQTDVNDSNLGLCRFCMVNPKNGVFVHNNCLHLCCCYKCAVKVWKKRKSCPICNCKIKNVTKLFVH